MKTMACLFVQFNMAPIFLGLFCDAIFADSTLLRIAGSVWIIHMLSSCGRVRVPVNPPICGRMISWLEISSFAIHLPPHGEVGEWLKPTVC